MPNPRKAGLFLDVFIGNLGHHVWAFQRWRLMDRKDNDDGSVTLTFYTADGDSPSATAERLRRFVIRSTWSNAEAIWYEVRTERDIRAMFMDPRTMARVLGVL